MALDVESIGLAMDTSGVERGIKSLDELASRGPKVEQSLQSVERAAKQAGQGVSTLGQSAAATGVDKVGAAGERAAQGLGKMGQAAQSAVSSQAALSRAVDGFTQTERKYIQSLLDEFNALDQTRAAKAAYIAQQKGMSQAAQEVARAVGSKIEAYKAERAELDKLSNASEISAQSMAGIARAGVQAIAGSALLVAIKGVGQALFDASAQAERFRTTLNFATGGQGVQEIAYLRRVTGELGLQFASTAQAYSGFQAAARGTALEGQKAKDVFESIAKASAVMGLSAEQSGGVLLALQQMISKGTVQAEELRGQLGERLPGAFQIAAKAMGVTTAELGKMLEQGQVVADDFLPKFAEALEEDLGGAAEKAATRLDAAVNRFDAAWERLKQNAGDSGSSNFIADQMNSAAGALDYVSVAMEKARGDGGGFASQMLAAASAMHDMTLVGKRTEQNMYDNAKATKEAEAKLADLQKRAATEGTSAWLLKEIGQTNRYIATLQQARRERDALEGEGAQQRDPRDIPATMTRSASYARWAQEQKESEQKMLEIRMRQSGVNKQYLQELKDLEQALARQVITQDEYTQRVSALAKTTWDASVAGKAAAKTSSERASAAKAEQSTYDKLISSIQTKIAQNEAEIAGGAKLSENQKLRIKYAEDLQGSLQGITAAQRSVIEGYLDEHKAAELANVAAREAIKAAQETAAARNREAAGIDAWIRAQEDAARQSLKSVQDRIHSMADEARAIELSQALNVSLAEAIELVAIARLEEKQAGFYEGSEGWEAIQREINARRELLGLIGSKEAREANKRAADEAAKDWERTAQTISDTLADYIMGGGKDAAQYLKRLFATLVLQPIVQVGVGALLGAGPGGQLVSAAMGGAGGGSALLNNAGLVGAGAQAIWGLSAGASTASLVGANAVGMAGGDALGALIAGNGAWAGVGTGAGAAAGSGFMGALSAIPGWGWALAGIAALGGILAGMDDSGTPHIGGSAAWSSSQGLRTNLGFLDDQEGLPGYNPNDNIDNQFGSGMPWVQDNEQVRGTLGVMAQTIASTLDSFAKAFGQQAGYDVALGFADDSSKDGSWGALRIALGDRELLNWNDDRESKWAPRIFSDGEQGWEEFTAATAQDLRDVMTEMDIPGWVKDSLEGLGDSFDLDALGAVVTQIGAVNTAFDALSFGVAAFADLTDEARGRLIQESGGLQGFAASASNYYDKFYTDDEKHAFKEDALSKELERLGLEMPNTQRGFRELVEAQIALGESGAETAARLMGLSDAAFEVLPAADEATSALRTMADAAKESFGITADTVKGLLDDILENAGSANEARNMGASGFEEMVTSAIFDSLLSNISGMVMAQIVAPLIAGATTSGAVLAAGGATGGAAVAGGGVMGGSASAAGGSVAGQSIAQGGAAAASAMVAGGAAVGTVVGNVLEAARAQMQAVSGLLNDPAFADMLAEFGKGFGGLAGDLFDLKSSIGGGLSSVGGSFGGAASAAKGLEASLKGLTSAIEDEIKRLRGIMEEASPNKGYDALMGEFATATAAARAGDEDARGLLPGLSKQIDALLPDRAASSAELALMRGWLAGSLAETLKAFADADAAKSEQKRLQDEASARGRYEGGKYFAWLDAGSPLGGWSDEEYEDWYYRKYLGIPALATGTNYVPQDMLAMLHKGEAVVPERYNPAAGGQQVVVPQAFAQPLWAGESLIVEALREEFAQVREENRALALEAQRLRLRLAQSQERTEGLIAMQEG
ncbi:tape measure protein [Acidovorax sp. MR-S7]|uniref:tape measure protein n=1 Tax=Acidovorax sp. MR-S7 TaxID=1268622 RepID=UPI0003A1752A|nr:tape measure protein [Acidovorax sp. MR-S7]GAD20965.1 hypothetical protein AVS7_00726 [Acidovorax sp. MR-S7]